MGSARVGHTWSSDSGTTSCCRGEDVWLLDLQRAPLGRADLGDQGAQALVRCTVHLSARPPAGWRGCRSTCPQVPPPAPPPVIALPAPARAPAPALAVEWLAPPAAAWPVSARAARPGAAPAAAWSSASSAASARAEASVPGAGLAKARDPGVEDLPATVSCSPCSAASPSSTSKAS